MLVFAPLLVLLMSNHVLTQIKSDISTEEIVYRYFELARNEDFESSNKLVAPESVIAERLLSDSIDFQWRLAKQEGVEIDEQEWKAKRLKKYRATFLRSASGSREILAVEYPKQINKFKFEVKKTKVYTYDDKEIVEVFYGNDNMNFHRYLYFVRNENNEWQIYDIMGKIKVTLTEDENGDLHIVKKPDL
jgi:sucrose-6-phosphate hydrolase SacC (GH32 family)